MSKQVSFPQKRNISFAEFWQHYSEQHVNPANQVLHVVGTVGSVICIGLGIASSWIWFAGVLPIGFGTAWLGHLLFERNRPLTFTYPLWSVIAVYRMVALIITGRRRLS